MKTEKDTALRRAIRATLVRAYHNLNPAPKIIIERGTAAIKDDARFPMSGAKISLRNP